LRIRPVERENGDSVRALVAELVGRRREIRLVGHGLMVGTVAIPDGAAGVMDRQRARRVTTARSGVSGSVISVVMKA